MTVCHCRGDAELGWDASPTNFHGTASSPSICERRSACVAHPQSPHNIHQSIIRDFQLYPTWSLRENPLSRLLSLVVIGDGNCCGFPRIRFLTEAKASIRQLLSLRHPRIPQRTVAKREAGRRGRRDLGQLTAREHGAGQYQTAGPRGALPDSREHPGK